MNTNSVPGTPTQDPHAGDQPSRQLIDTCVHCGFCLPTCPTYLLWGEEMDSPRGRIYLMKANIEERSPLSPSMVGHFDRCLGCLACVTACPSGVQYGTLIEQMRTHIEQEHERPLADRLFRRILLSLVPYPSRMRLALAPLAVLGRFLPKVRPPEPPAAPTGGNGATPGRTEGGLFTRVRSAMAVAPPVTWRGLFARVAARTPASGPERLRVGLLEGCVQRLAFGGVNEATVRVLAAEGCTVEAPHGQGCCGALTLHSGHRDDARTFARRTIEVFERAGVERVVVNAAGCGSAMKEYGELLAGDPAWAARAHAFSAKVRDVSELLVELGESRAPRHPVPARVVYHDACHLAHGQGVRSQPRALLQAIPGVEVVSLPEAEICCGSAGIYNLVQPEPAAQLGRRKAQHIASARPDVIATANPGCILQIAAAGRALGYEWPVVHPVEIVDASIHRTPLRGVAASAR